MTDFDADGAELSITLEKKQMAKLLRWTVYTLEVFMQTRRNRTLCRTGDEGGVTFRREKTN